MWYLTQAQHRALKALVEVTDRLGRPPSKREWARSQGVFMGGTTTWLTIPLENGLIEHSGHNWRLTPLGRKYLTIYDKAAELLE